LTDGPTPQVPAPGVLRIEVVYALSDRQSRVRLELPPGATVGDALEAVCDREPFAGLELATLPVGIYGERVGRERVLADHDRVEIYRPLLLDPVEARRRRSRAGETP
jgi:putative ubiquitin-RnfH superfamily antitoxin RatB of RatAB toxin-antitoxin module